MFTVIQWWSTLTHVCKDEKGKKLNWNHSCVKRWRFRWFSFLSIFIFVIIKDWTERKNTELFSSLCVQDKRHTKANRHKSSEELVHNLDPGTLFSMTFKPIFSVRCDIISQITLHQLLPLLIYFFIIYIYLAFNQFIYWSEVILGGKNLWTELSYFNEYLMSS